MLKYQSRNEVAIGSLSSPEEENPGKGFWARRKTKRRRRLAYSKRSARKHPEEGAPNVQRQPLAPVPKTSAYSTTRDVE